MVYNFFDEKTGSGVSLYEDLAEELRKPVIKKFERRKVYTRFRDNIWAENLVKMGSLSSFNCGVKCLLCIIDAFTKYASVKCLKDEKAKIILHGSIEIVNESRRQPNNLWLIKEDNLIITLCKNGLMIMMF